MPRVFSLFTHQSGSNLGLSIHWGQSKVKVKVIQGQGRSVSKTLIFKVGWTFFGTRARSRSFIGPGQQVKKDRRKKGKLLIYQRTIQQLVDSRTSLSGLLPQFLFFMFLLQIHIKFHTKTNNTKFVFLFWLNRSVRIHLIFSLKRVDKN